VNSQYAVAVHVLSLINTFPDHMSSADIAGSVGTNPVVIRNVTASCAAPGCCRPGRA